MEEARTSPYRLGEQLCEAAKEGRLSDVRHLINSGAGVNYTDRISATPLLYAAKNAHADVVSLLLQRGADVNAVNCSGSSALHFAAGNDSSGRCVELLVRAGADVNARNIDGATPLHRAALYYNEEVVRALLAAGARRDLKGWGGYYKGRTPFETTTSPIGEASTSGGAAATDEEQRARRRVDLLLPEVMLKIKEARTSPSRQGEQLCEAADEGSLSDVQRLIDSGADVNYTDQRGLTPLHRAAMHAHADIVSLFLQRGANVNSVGINGNSALHMAALTRGCVELLVRAGADVNARNIDGETPLHWAEQSNNEEAVRALLAAGARRDLKPWGGVWKGKTPFETTSSIREAPTTGGAAAGGEGERKKQRVELRVQEAMEEARTSPSPLGEQLCKAAKEGRLNDVRHFLDSGADVNYTDRNCSTPLDNAIWKMHADVVSLLLQRGADMYAVDQFGCSALHWAAMRDHSGRCVELLVRAGADVNARDQYGLSPLHYAAECNNEKAVRALLSAGARRDLRPWGGGWKGKTPFETTTSPMIQDLLRL